MTNTHPDEDQQTAADGQIALAAMLLLKRGQASAAALLLEVEDHHWEWAYDNWGKNYFKVSLSVPYAVFDSFDHDALETIRSALADASSPDEGIESVRAVPSSFRGDWRAEVRRHLAGEVTNHTTLSPLQPANPSLDGLHFRDSAELAVYRELKRVQESLPEHDTLTIVPNCAARVLRHTWEPDFIVVYRSRVGVIEVDGTTHLRKRESDKSRERIFENSGFAYVDRFDARECETEAVRVLVTRFLAKVDAMSK